MEGPSLFLVRIQGLQNILFISIIATLMDIRMACHLILIVSHLFPHSLRHLIHQKPKMMTFIWQHSLQAHCIIGLHKMLMTLLVIRAVMVPEFDDSNSNAPKNPQNMILSYRRSHFHIDGLIKIIECSVSDVGATKDVGQLLDSLHEGPLPRCLKYCLKMCLQKLKRRMKSMHTCMHILNCGITWLMSISARRHCDLTLAIDLVVLGLLY